MKNKHTPIFSVIIPALNEEKYIKYSLQGLMRQIDKDFEIIVVDGGSKDKTKSIAKRYAKVVTDLKPGAAHSRNTGAKIAKGKYFVFLDADTKPSRGLIAEYLKAFSDNKTVAATGPVLPLERTNRSIRMGYKFVSVYFAKFMLMFGRPSVNGMNFAVKRDAFEAVGGFNDNFKTYEDWDLSRRLAKIGKIAFYPNAVVYTSVRRIKAWGILGFTRYHVGNMLRYFFLKKPKEEYEAIR
ncbi:MAG: glycosyltransferase [Candidatus Micrarchaeaceae archaeon]